MPQKLKIIIAVTVSLLLVVLIFQKRQKPQTLGVARVNTVKIGSVLPLTGPFASVAEEIVRGAQLAVTDARDRGINIEYISEDDAFEQTKSVSAAQKLTSQDRVVAVFTAVSQEVKPMAKVFNETNTPLLSVWDSNKTIKSAGRFIFTSGFSAEWNGEKMATFARNRSLEKVAVVSQLEDWSGLIANSFVESFEKQGGKIVFKERLDMEMQDFRTVIAKIKNLDVDGVYIPLNPPGNSRFLIQAKQMGLATMFMTGDAFIEEEIQAAGAAAEGVYLTDLYGENLEVLIQKYNARYGKEPHAPVFVGFGYDAINTLLQANTIALSEGSSLRDALTKVDFQGVGARINFAGTNQSERIERIYKVINRKASEVER